MTNLFTKLLSFLPSSPLFCLNYCLPLPPRCSFSCMRHCDEEEGATNFLEGMSNKGETFLSPPPPPLLLLPLPLPRPSSPFLSRYDDWIASFFLPSPPPPLSSLLFDCGRKIPSNPLYFPFPNLRNLTGLSTAFLCHRRKRRRGRDWEDAWTLCQRPKTTRTTTRTTAMTAIAVRMARRTRRFPIYRRSGGLSSLSLSLSLLSLYI